MVVMLEAHIYQMIVASVVLAVNLQSVALVGVLIVIESGDNYEIS